MLAGLGRLVHVSRDLRTFASLPDAKSRDAVVAWLDEERGLRVKNPEAPIGASRGTLHALGHAIRRDGVVVLPRARRRLHRHVQAGLHDAAVDWGRSRAG